MADIYVNIDEALLRFNGNTQIFKMLLKKFKDSPYFNELDEHLAAHDLVQAERSAHTIKGTAGNLSLTALYEMACTLDDQLKSEEDYTNCYEEFQNIYTQTLMEINDFIANN